MYLDVVSSISLIQHNILHLLRFIKAMVSVSNVVSPKSQRDLIMSVFAIGLNFPSIEAS